MDIHSAKVLIIDFGSQFTQLIARRIRELNVYCEIIPHDSDFESIVKAKPSGVIFSGGPNSVYADDSPLISSDVFKLGVPILGICYGMQLIAEYFGGKVIHSNNREFGYAEVSNLNSDLFDNVITESEDNRHNLRIQVWMSHGDKVSELPDGFNITAQTDSCPIAAIADVERKIYGVQFHPEVTHTLQGQQILANFVLKICRCESLWKMPNFADEAIGKIRNTVGKDRVILGLSGGVDSTVAGILIHQAIGEQLICIFIDTGLLRLNEATQIMNMYEQNLKLNIIKVDAQEEFYTALSGVIDPEQKRKIIGRLFVEIFQREAKLIDGVKYLAQGTIYPDVIESAASGKTSHNIKSHHNVGGLPENLNLHLLEPLRELFKDEVKKLGLALGIPPQLINRHPFPGPGLAVRIIGEVTPEFVMLLRHADAIFMDELYKNDLYNQVAQAFVVFLPVKSVGVMGDGRTYEYVLAIRAVETTDFMTANVANLPMNFIVKVANRIINEVQGVSRVVYDVSGKPPATIEWE